MNKHLIFRAFAIFIIAVLTTVIALLLTQSDMEDNDSIMGVFVMGGMIVVLIIQIIRGHKKIQILKRGKRASFIISEVLNVSIHTGKHQRMSTVKLSGEVDLPEKGLYQLTAVYEFRTLHIPLLRQGVILPIMVHENDITQTELISEEWYRYAKRNGYAPY